MSINVVVLVGNPGRDPELRFFESGSCVCEFSLAINRLPRDGQEQAPLWVNCKAWGKTAQVAGDYVRKGSKVAVVGRLEIEQWTDRSSGEVRSKTLVVVDRLELCGSRGGSNGGFIGGAEPSRAEHQGHPDTSGSAPSAGHGAGAAQPAAPSSGGWGNDWTSPPAGGIPLSDEEVPF
ncbi:MAG: single-stranded DNA-binding protein [Cyanobacteria bacterium]|nr:single-stranded DNA-binding protein [Cyanobacteriota bacterium]